MLTWRVLTLFDLVLDVFLEAEFRREDRFFVGTLINVDRRSKARVFTSQTFTLTRICGQNFVIILIEFD